MLFTLQSQLGTGQLQETQCCVNSSGVRYTHTTTKVQVPWNWALPRGGNPSLHLKLNKIPQRDFTKGTAQKGRMQRQSLTEVWQHGYLQPLGKVDGGIVQLQQLGQLGVLARPLHGSAETHRDGRHQSSQGLDQQHSHHLMRVLENLWQQKSKSTLPERTHSRESSRQLPNLQHPRGVKNPQVSAQAARATLTC